MKIIEIARVCHEVNRAYCQAFGDDTQKPWGEAPDWQRFSAMQGVQFHIDKPDASAAASHESWLEVKRSEGWTYGPVKCESTREHPCFVPFDDLPREQQAKDYIFRAIVHALADTMPGS